MGCGCGGSAKVGVNPGAKVASGDGPGNMQGSYYWNGPKRTGRADTPKKPAK